MKRKISKVSKTVLIAGVTVCAAFCLTYIVWNLTAFKDDICILSKRVLAAEAGKLLLTCVSELILGSYLIERIKRDRAD